MKKGYTTGSCAAAATKAAAKAALSGNFDDYSNIMTPNGI